MEPGYPRTDPGWERRPYPPPRDPRKSVKPQPHAHGPFGNNWPLWLAAGVWLSVNTVLAAVLLYMVSH